MPQGRHFSFSYWLARLSYYSKIFILYTHVMIHKVVLTNAYPPFIFVFKLVLFFWQKLHRKWKMKFHIIILLCIILFLICIYLNKIDCCIFNIYRSVITKLWKLMGCSSLSPHSIRC